VNKLNIKNSIIIISNLRSKIVTVQRQKAQLESGVERFTVGVLVNESFIKQSFFKSIFDDTENLAFIYYDPLQNTQ
jgi:hypothetical protein